MRLGAVAAFYTSAKHLAVGLNWGIGWYVCPTRVPHICTGIRKYVVMGHRLHKQAGGNSCATLLWRDMYF